MSSPELVRRFHNFWSDFNAVNCLRFPELPPADLLRSLKLEMIQLPPKESASTPTPDPTPIT